MMSSGLDDISRKEEQQKIHYFLLSELQKMARELPLYVLCYLKYIIAFVINYNKLITCEIKEKQAPLTEVYQF